MSYVIHDGWNGWDRKEQRFYRHTDTLPRWGSLENAHVFSAREEAQAKLDELVVSAPYGHRYKQDRVITVQQAQALLVAEEIRRCG